MGTVEVITWVAAGMTLVAVVIAGWQLWVARRRVRHAVQQASRADKLVAAAKSHAEQASGSAQSAHSQARWAWEQVKEVANQLDEARKEHRGAAQVEQWEWAYALTTTARELVDTSQELIRIGLDGRVAPHYRQAADRHYRQACQRWQDTMIKALARMSPPLELQQQVITFAHVHQRLYGHIDVLLRAAETGTLAEDDPVIRQVHGLRHELANVHRHLQRTISTSLTTPEEESSEALTTHYQITQSPPGDLQASESQVTPDQTTSNRAPRNGADSARA